jgi:transposase
VRRKRRTHSPEFKSKAALAALKGDLTMAGLVKKFDVHAKIGQLTMENNFLERGLERIHGPRGKKW